MAAVKLLLSRKNGDNLTCCLPCVAVVSGEGDINVLRQVLHPLFQNTMKKHILKTCFFKLKDKHHDHIYTFNAYDTDVFRISAYCLDRFFFGNLPTTSLHCYPPVFFHRVFFLCKCPTSRSFWKFANGTRSLGSHGCRFVWVVCDIR